jgi:hypothetical protein
VIWDALLHFPEFFSVRHLGTTSERSVFP